jgi:hypothetical protein
MFTIGIGLGIGIGIGNRPPIPKVKFDLLENGLDFITEAVAVINTNSNNKRLKYAVIHLCSGIELILKEVVRKKDWRLLFPMPKEATQEQLQSGDFESVRFKKLIARLECECKVKFSEDDKKIIEELRLKRNKIEHFKVDEKVSAVKSLCSKTLNFLIQFIDQNIDISTVSPASKKYINNLPKELAKFNSFVSVRTQTIKPKYDKKVSDGIVVMKCPNCLQNTLFNDSHLKCLFCYYTNSPEILTLEINRTFNSDKQLTIKACKKCTSTTLVQFENKIICLKCNTLMNVEDISTDFNI